MIHVFGDSHSALFSGTDARFSGDITCQERNPHDVVPGFVTWDVGPALAYNLEKYIPRMEGALLSYRQSDPEGGILLCFGEIDVRMHLVRQAEKRGESVREAAERTARKYMETVCSLHNRFGHVSVFGPHPMYENPIGPPEGMHCGTYHQMYEAGEVFNLFLEHNLPKDIKFASIFHDMRREWLHRCLGYYMDDFHLKPTACLTLAMRQLERVGIV
jgi:hypothetical protein